MVEVARRGMRSHVVAAIILLLPLPSFVGAFGWGNPFGSSSSQQHATDELDAASFDGFLKDHAVTAILFYAPWCFYSQQMMPSWDLAAQKLMLHDPPVHLAKLDAHRHTAIGDRYGINAFPTMKLFVDGAAFDYDSREGRGWQQIVKWVNHHIDRDHILKSVEDVDHYLNDNDLNVVGLFSEGSNNSAFYHSARHFEDVMFAEVRGPEISQEVARHLERHATLLCETIDIGKNQNNTKEITLPREGMHCSNTPRNPQRPEWTDKFAAEVHGNTVIVRRTDSSDGWQQNLQLRCCDDETKMSNSEKYHISVPSVVMFMPHDERFAIFDGDVQDAHALDKWISARRTPMVMRLSEETAEKILGSGLEQTPALFLISRDPQEQLEEELRKAAKQLRGRVLVCVSGLASQLERRLASIAGLEDESEPIVTIIEARSGTGQLHHARKFRIPAHGITASAVVNFVTDYEQGKLKPWMRSEPEPTPEERFTDGVGVLVGTTFADAAQEETKDVLVDFYAPWCGHCRKFEPQYKALARKLKHVKSLKVTKIDATRNEVEGVTVMGYPTVILFPAGTKPKKQVLYHGARQPEEITTWLQEHCSIKFDPTPSALASGAEDPVASGLLDPSEEDL